MKTDHNGLIYRCSLCKARAARISEPNSGQCDHDGHRMSETAADYCDQLERENAELRKLVEQMREALELMLEGAMHDFHYVCQHRDNCLCWGCQKARIKAALAAERGER